MKRTVFIALLLSAAFAQAQLIERDNTEVLNEKSGDPIFVLSAKESVYSYEPESVWYKIRKEAIVRPQDLEGKLLNPNTILRNAYGDSIGYTIQEIKVKESRSEEQFRGDDKVYVILEGYLLKSKFQKNSIPEAQIEKILNTRSRTQQQEMLRDLKEIYPFEEQDFGDLTAHAFREEDKTVDKEKDFRVIVIYRNETSPYAFITNGHNITVEKFKKEWEDGDFKITYFYKPTQAQETTVQDIMYTFLAL